MKTRVCALLWLRKKTKRVETYVYLRLTHEGKRIEFSTGIKINKNDWDYKNKCLKKNVTNPFIANKLNAVKFKFDKIYTDLISNNVEIDLEKIKFLWNGGSINQFKSNNFHKATLSYVMKKYLEKSEQNVLPKTLSKLITYNKRIMEYVRIEHKQQDLNLAFVRYSFVDGLYMFAKSKLKYCFTSNKKLISYFKSLIDFAVLNEYISNNVIKSYKCAPYGGKKELLYLDMDQLQHFYEFNFSKDCYNYCKKLFLFQCFTGLAYVDLYNLTLNDIKQENGKTWIIKERQKTGVTSNIPLLPEAIEVLKEISFDIEKLDKDDKLINCLSNQVYNRELKFMSLELGLDFQLTTHIARKTFATVTLNKGNVSIETVAKMLGHANTKVTQSTYSKVLNTRIEREMKDFSFVENTNTIRLIASQ